MTAKIWYNDGMRQTRPTLKVHARNAKVDETVSRGRQLFQVDAEPNEILEGRELAERFAQKIKVDTSEANYIIESIQEFVLDELQAGNRLDFDLVSFLPRLSGALPTRDANPTDSGLVVLGHVKGRPSLRNALKGRLIPVNSLAPEWGVVYSVMDFETKAFDRIVIGHQIDIAGMNIAIDLDQTDEGVWLEDSKGGVVSRAEVSFSDAQVANCRFDDCVPPGKYTLVLVNRTRQKGSDYQLRRHCRSVVVA